MPEPCEYTVGWICAIPVEFVAAQEFLDEEHDPPESLPPHSKNNYALGKMGNHNIAIASLPLGEYGIAAAARVAEDMLYSFPKIRVGLMVGIGGGVPTRHDIRLGDIVVSIPQDGHGGVLQYDFGKTVQNQKFQLSGFLDQPPSLLRTAVGGLRTLYERKGHTINEAVEEILAKNKRLRRKFKRPDPSQDKLFQSDHTGDDASKLITRDERDEDADDPMIHYGLVASADQLMKDAIVRDRLANEKDVLCFEMEAAGLMNNFPCLVIRGICDYSDSHKNKEWQGYAAMVAAAYAKDLLCRQISPSHVEAEKAILETLNVIQNTIKETLSGVSGLTEAQDNREYESILNWLTPVNSFHQQNDLIKMRTEGTGEWFLESPEFKQWLTDPINNKTIFCQGIPGAGKTFIMSNAISHLERYFEEDSTVGTAYIFCDFRRETEQTPWDLLASLLKQFANQQPQMAAVRDLYYQHKKIRSKPGINDLFNLLISAVDTFSRVNILIDALDECQAYETREKFLQDLLLLQSNTNDKISILATSRPNKSTEANFEPCVKLQISAREADLQIYLNDRLNSFPYKAVQDPEIRNRILIQLSKAARGMFLLARLYVNALANEMTPRGIKRVLDELDSVSFSNSKNTAEGKARALDSAYDAAMKRIENQSTRDLELARLILSWVACSKQPLTSLDLQYATAIEIGARSLDKEGIADINDLISVCAGLLVVNQESNIVRLVHYTTKEYFDRSWKRWFPDAHIKIVLTSLTYLGFNIFDLEHIKSDDFLNHKGLEIINEEFDQIKRYPLYRYASIFWGHHVRGTLMEKHPSVLRFLQRPPEPYLDILIIRKKDGRLYDEMEIAHLLDIKMTGLQVAVYFGLLKSVKILIKKYPQWVSESPDPTQSPLNMAVKFHWTKIIELLLKKGAVLDIAVVKTALKKKNHTAMDIFTNKNLISFEESIEEDSMGHHTLQYAVSSRKEAMVRLLLEQDVKPHPTTLFKSMETAVASDSTQILKLLIEKGTVPKPYSSETSLSTGDKRKYVALVHVLLERGAESSFASLSPSLTLLVPTGLTEMFKSLIKRGAVLDTDPDKMPLSPAVEKDYIVLASFIFQRRYPPAIILKNGTQISRSNIEEYEIALMLLMKGAVPEGDSSKTKLFLAAAESGNDKAICTLLEFGANIEAKDSNGKTALYLAIREGYAKIVQILIDKGASVEGRYEDGESIFEHALRCDNRFILRLIQTRLSQISTVSSDTDLEPSDCELDLDSD